MNTHAQAHAYTHTHARKRTHTLLAMYIESMRTEWRTQKVRQLPRRFNSAKAQRTLDTRPSRRWRTDARVQDRADADLDFSVQGGQRGEFHACAALRGCCHRRGTDSTRLSPRSRCSSGTPASTPPTQGRRRCILARRSSLSALPGLWPAAAGPEMYAEAGQLARPAPLSTWRSLVASTANGLQRLSTFGKRMGRKVFFHPFPPGGPSTRWAG